MILQIIIIIYALSVGYNLFVFRDLDEELSKNIYHNVKYWLLMLSGPILCLKLIYVDISSRIYWYKAKKKIAKDIRVQLLQLFKENNMKVEGDNS